MKHTIELRRIRDFGEIINDTFNFLKENFKPLFSSLLVICGFFVLVGTVTTAFTQMSITNLVGTTPGEYDTGAALNYGVSAIFNAVILVLSQVSIYLVTLCYMAIYLEKKDSKPTLAEIWGFFKYYFLRVLGSGFLVGVLFVIALVLCIIPGIYVMPAFYLIFPIMVMENATFGYSFSKSFRLIKDYWWTVFGVIFVCSLIVSVLNSFATVPLSLVVSLRLFVSLKHFTLPFVVFFAILQNVLTLAYTILAIGTTLCYFSLQERKDGTGLLNRIEMFGKDTDKADDLPVEQY